jgi:uncharacterized membrane protein (DUF2068 family)
LRQFSACARRAALGRLPAGQTTSRTAVRDTPLPQPHSLGVLRLIAVFKFLKATLVIVTGLGLLRFYDPAFQAALHKLIGGLQYAFEQKLLREGLAFLSGMSPKRIQIIAAATFAYAGLFLVEGVGLWLGLHWAEVLTVVATSSLIPLEVYELARHPSVNKVLVILINVAILAYLIWRLRREAASRRATPR